MRKIRCDLSDIDGTIESDTNDLYMQHFTVNCVW